MCSGSEAGSYLRLINFVYHSTLGLRVIKKREEEASSLGYIVTSTIYGRERRGCLLLPGKKSGQSG